MELGVSIDDIAPHPKRPRLLDPESPHGDLTPDMENDEQNAASVSEDEIDEADWMEGPLADDEELEPDGSFLSTSENRKDSETVSISDQPAHESQRGQKVDIPLSRLRAFIKSAYPDLRIGRKSLEELKGFSLSVATEFVAGVIQDKVWTTGDLRYLESVHMKLTKEDGMSFLKERADQFPWGIFNCTPGWENVRNIERSADESVSMETVAKDQPLITKFFGSAEK